MFGTDIGY